MLIKYIAFFTRNLPSSWCTGELFALHVRDLRFELGRVEPVMLIFFCFYVVESGLLYFARDAQVGHWMCQCAIYVQDLHKIVVISPMRNICARFAQDCAYFLNAQYMRKICTKLCLFPQCAIYAQDCARLYLFLQCAINAQDLRKIVLISPMRN